MIVFVSTITRLPSSPIDAPETFIASLQKYLPHWTPSGKDHIVYATVDEAQSATLLDVDSLLMKLKQDLHISEAGYPQHVLLCEDYANLEKGPSC